ncbi:MAG: hypothetical protein JWM85_3149 [Acidimicrobiaceae bacterium]|nr:hypothetical protein [Acidimicrobiaceae bacterium]
MPVAESPWIFRYVEESPSRGLAPREARQPPLRPVVPVRLRALGEVGPRVTALVDSGSERTLAAPGLVRALRLDLDGVPTTTLGIGGKPRQVRFADVEMELFRDLLGDPETCLDSWMAHVGFFDTWEPPWAVVLGQVGFFDRFTVTFNRSVPALAVESWDAFDQRFGVQIEEVGHAQPRFQP